MTSDVSHHAEERGGGEFNLSKGGIIRVGVTPRFFPIMRNPISFKGNYLKNQSTTPSKR
jgi:hypothetical protein